MHRNPFSLSTSPRVVIEELRRRRNFRSVRALALAAGMPQPTLQRYLAGTSATMSMEHFAALAAALDVTISQLLGEVPISDDPRIDRVLRVMESANDAGWAAIVAAASALGQALHDPPAEETPESERPA